MGGRGEWNNGRVGDARPQRFGVVFDLVFLFVEFMFAEKVVDGFVVLHKQDDVFVRLVEGEIVRGITYDFEELSFHLIFPSFRLELVCNSKDLLNRPRYHTRRILRLEWTIRAANRQIMNEGNSHYHPP